MMWKTPHCWRRALLGLSLALAVQVVATAHVDAAAKGKAEPWFLVEKAASRQRQMHPQTGFLLRLLWLPQSKLASTYTLPSLSMELGRKHLSILGHADLHWSQLWLPTISGGTPPLLSFDDNGSRLELSYRWKSSVRSDRFTREIGLFWLPFSSATFQMGETLEALWVFRVPRPLVSYFPVRLGVTVAWEWFRLESLLEIHWSRDRNAPTDGGSLPAPLLMSRLRFRPSRHLELGVDGGFLFGGEHSNVGVNKKPYVAWGVHPVVQFHIGDRPAGLVFLRRRRRDPRSQQEAIAPLQRGKGLVLTAEFSAKGQLLQDPTTLVDLRWEMAYATTVRCRGQWGILSAELLFHWHSFSWSVYDRAGLVPFQMLLADSPVEPLFLVGFAAGVQVHRTVSLGVRLELLRPASHGSPLPAGLVGTAPLPGVPTSIFVVHSTDTTILPPGTEIIVQTTAMGHVRWEPWPFLTIMAEAWFSVDPNRSTFATSGNTARRVAITEYLFGTELLLQARFR